MLPLAVKDERRLKMFEKRMLRTISEAYGVEVRGV
jgi:hypothetical protein